MIILLGHTQVQKQFPEYSLGINSREGESRWNVYLKSKVVALMQCFANVFLLHIVHPGHFAVVQLLVDTLYGICYNHS